MARNPNSYVTFTLLDFSEEKASTQIGIPGYNVLTNAGVITDVGALRAAIDGITLGSIVQENLTWFATKYAAAAPTDQEAQREKKWLVRVQDTVTLAEYRVEIPTADLTGVQLIPGTDNADLGQPPMDAFVSAFEAVYRSPDGNPATVLQVSYVGRRT